MGGSGSSPRVRGTHRRQLTRQRHPRFIPACAGNTETDPAVAFITPVHPRVCGEHGGTWANGDSMTGSSPRVRGTPVGEVLSPPSVRFIPACAGNTGIPPSQTAAIPVHPRVCGEHTAAETSPAPLAGSSPRVRGTPTKSMEVYWAQRFIPACAGNTPAAQAGRVRMPVHPRVCGEHFIVGESV